MRVMELDRQHNRDAVTPITGLEPAHPVQYPPVQTRPAGLPRWKPLAGEALLDRLRVTGRPRPSADPRRITHLREIIEGGPEEESEPESAGGQGVASHLQPIIITKDRLNRVLACDAHAGEVGFDPHAPTPALACGALIDVLFRQLVTIGWIGDPMAEGLAALAVDDQQAHLVSWIEALPVSERASLAEEVGRQCRGLAERWPTLDPGWLPRTQVPMRVGLADGAIQLSGRVDLAIGRSGLKSASVAIVEIKSGARRPEHQADLHFYALIETLINPAPPFVVATYYTRTGELDVDPVSDELLITAARRTSAGARSLRRLAAGSPPKGPDRWCRRCGVPSDCGPDRPAGPDGPDRPDGPGNSGSGQWGPR